MQRLTLDWIQLAAAVACVQGVMLVGALTAQRNNRTANRLLAALMAAFTVYLASGIYYETGLFREYPQYFGLSWPATWLFGPLLYLYAAAASDRAWRLGRRHLLHFLPAIAVLLIGLPFFLMSGTEKLALYDRLLSGDVPARITMVEPTKYVSGIAYTIATIWLLRRHRRRVEESYSNTARVNLRWLLRLAGSAAVTWALATTHSFTNAGGRLREEHVTLAIAIIVYAIGYRGLRQPEVFRYETAEHPIPVASDTSAAPGQRYDRSRLAPDDAHGLEQSLRDVMEREQPWKDSELTLPDLAARLDTTPHKLSEVLNARIGHSFHDFVNAYRVREVQRRIEAGDAGRLKMLALALDAGFASKSTFNDVFKKHTNMTPSTFRAQVTGN
jgi:AraC-like DNA-binding protein